MQAVAGKSPSRPFRPPIQGAWSRDVETLLWKGSSQALFPPFNDTHLKQSMENTKKIDWKKFGASANKSYLLPLCTSKERKKEVIVCDIISFKVCPNKCLEKYICYSVKIKIVNFEFK